MRTLWVMLAALLLTPATSAQEDVIPPARIVVLSVPTGSTIYDGALQQLGTTPDTLEFTMGQYELQVSHEECQPHSHRIDVKAGQRRVLEFVLMPVAPEPPLPEDLGLAYEPTTPLISTEKAEKIKSKATTAAEIFLVFPFMHGVMALAVIDDSSEYPAREFAIGGAALVAGSYLLGRYLYKRKLGEINETNLFLQDANADAKIHNNEVDRAIRQAHADAVIVWRQESAERGVVLEHEYFQADGDTARVHD